MPSADRSIPRLAIEYLPLDDLKPDPRNARTHTPRQIRQIAKSIQTFGFGVPALIDGDGRILSGHGRVAACRSLGMAEIPVVRLAHLTEPQARAFQIADNRLTELGGWDERILGETLRDLSLADLTFDLDVIGFEVAEIDLKIGALDGGSDDADDEPDPPKGPAITRPGDLWTVGAHRILCGDSLAEASYHQLLGEDRAHAVFADPPYNVRVQGHVGGRGKIKHREFAMASGEMSEAEYTALLVGVFSRLRDWTAAGSISFVAIDWRHLHEMLVAGRRCFTELKNICVWAKTQPGMGSLYRSQHEMVVVFKNGDAPHRNNVQLGRFGRSRSNLWTYASPASFGRTTEEGSLLADHPTPKPVAMVADAILDVTQRGDLVLDPFLGGGATLIAAERTGRACRGIEIDPLYVDTCLRRIIRHSGLDPVRADGRSFLELEKELVDGE